MLSLKKRKVTSVGFFLFILAHFLEVMAECVSECWLTNALTRDDYVADIKNRHDLQQSHNAIFRADACWLDTSSVSAFIAMIPRMWLSNTGRQNVLHLTNKLYRLKSFKWTESMLWVLWWDRNRKLNLKNAKVEHKETLRKWLPDF